MENKYISVTYKMYTTEDGKRNLSEEVVVSEPFSFISGLGVALERFEKELVALNAGDKFNFVVTKEEAFGDYIPEGVKTLDREIFVVNGKFDDVHIYEGAIIPLQDKEGGQFYASVLKVAPDGVTVDLNHPYAGKDLTFEGTVIESRPATNAEIEQAVKRLSGGCGGGCQGGGCEGGCCGGCGGGC